MKNVTVFLLVAVFAAMLTGCQEQQVTGNTNPVGITTDTQDKISSDQSEITTVVPEPEVNPYDELIAYHKARIEHRANVIKGFKRLQKISEDAAPEAMETLGKEEYTFFSKGTQDTPKLIENLNAKQEKDKMMVESLEILKTINGDVDKITELTNKILENASTTEDIKRFSEASMIK